LSKRRSFRRQKRQSGQVMVLVAVALLAMIASVALILLAGSAEWQKNQLQELADSAALDSALKIGVGCDTPKATAVITEADNFLATRRTRTGSLAVTAGTCATPYKGQDTFAGGLTTTINYPYRAHQQQVEVILTLVLPISFGSQVGSTNTTVVRRAVAQQLAGSVPAVSATTLTCAGGQVNVAGSVVAQNLIARTGTCALYAHTRFDAASGTYSDLGNISVYMDAQSWTAPGTCVAGSNSGSSSAICADGFEISGHSTPACAAASTSYLSAGDKTVNPNPCAAGMAPYVVPPVSTNLPPEPNLDASAVATLQGTGGAACAAGTVYPNIVAGGSTVATGLAPAPIKDASGFWHFKPSCYGYLNPSSLSGGGGGISNRQIGTKSAVSSPTVTPTLPANSLAGTLLVATIRSAPSGTAVRAPANWVLANSTNQAGAARTEIWYYPNNPGGIASAVFGVPTNSIAQMTEWLNVATASPLDQTGAVASGSNQASLTLSTSAATSSANELVITDFGLEVQSPQTYTPGGGWTSLVSDQPRGFASDYRLNLPAGIATETATVNQATTWSGVIAAFKPGAGSGGAVLDPGFYYFNGSGFAGGGGICLSGGTLLARDVTMEFVNTAGFSSGTCAAGGGASCASPCQFGSDPASAAVDSPSNLTWFASPCTLSPTASDASCPGSSWCPAGDRSCTNQLIWAPATNTGQINLNGNSNKAWLLGSINWPGTCSIQVNGTGTIAGAIACGPLSLTAAVGAGIAVGSDYGISTAIAEAVLIE
jgi:hypothetical protein